MGLLEPLKRPLFARFFAGQAVSQLGDHVFFLALTWQVLRLGGTAATLGAVLAALTGAQLALLLWGGVASDRFPRRTLVVASDALQMLLAAILALLAFSGALTIPALLVLAALFGAAQAFGMPALRAFVPETVPAEDLQAANSLYQGTQSLAAVAGPALGALLVAAFGTGAAFAVNAASFAVSAALLASARVPARATAARATSPILREAREGLRYVARTPWLWITLAVFAVVNAVEAGPRNAVLPLLVTEDLGGGVRGLGWVLSAGAAGGVAAFLVLGAMPPVRRRGLVAYALTLAAGVAFALLGLATSVGIAVLLAFVRGAAFTGFAVLWETNLMSEVEEGMRGRAFALDALASFSTIPLGAIGAGLAAEAFGPRPTLLVAGAVIALASLVGLFHRPARAFTAEERRPR